MLKGLLMKSETTKNIKVKRIKRRRRRFRIFIKCLVLILFFGIIGWIGFHVYEWGARTYNAYYSSFREYETRKAEKRNAGDERFDGYTNVLIMGIDEGIPEEQGKHADALVMLSFDNNKGKVRTISIPRGTLITLPGQKEPQQIGSVFSMGGAPLTVRATSQLLGVAVHQYVVVEEKVLEEIVDILGGIELYVEENMDYEDPEAALKIHLKKGYQLLDGKQSLHYLRFRSDELGDIGRIKRQQKFVRAFYKKVLNLDVMTKVPQLAELMQKRLKTSAEIFDSAHIISVIKGLSGELPKAVVIPGTPQKDNDTVWMVNQQELTAKMTELFPEMAVQ